MMKKFCLILLWVFFISVSSCFPAPAHAGIKPAPSPTLEITHKYYQDDPEKAQILQQWLDLATSSPSPVSTQRHSSSIIAYAIAAAFISILTLIYKLIKDSLRRKFDERRRKKEVVNLLTPENKQNPEQPESRPRVSLKKE